VKHQVINNDILKKQSYL